MKLFAAFIAFLCATIFVGCSTAPSHRNASKSGPVEIVVTITCSDPAANFAGTIVTDGKTEQLSGGGRAEFHAKGHQFICSFKKTEPRGQISISVSEGGRVLGGSTSRPGPSGVRAELLRTSTAVQTLFTTF